MSRTSTTNYLLHLGTHYSPSQTGRSALLQQTRPQHNNGMRTWQHGRDMIQQLRHDTPMRRDDSTMASGLLCGIERSRGPRRCSTVCDWQSRKSHRSCG